MCINHTANRDLYPLEAPAPSALFINTSPQ